MTTFLGKSCARYLGVYTEVSPANIHQVLNLLAITTFLVRGFSNPEQSWARFGYYCFAAGLLLLVAVCCIARISFLVEWQEKRLRMHITKALGVYLIIMSLASFLMIYLEKPITWSDWMVGIFFFTWSWLVIFTTYMVENSDREIRDIRRKIRFVREVARRMQLNAPDNAHFRSNSVSEGNIDGGSSDDSY